MRIAPLLILSVLATCNKSRSADNAVAAPPNPAPIEDARGTAGDGGRLVSDDDIAIAMTRPYEVWYGLYAGKRKLGTMQITARTASNELFEVASTITVRSQGSREMRFVETAHYSRRPPFALVFNERTATGQATLRATRRGDKMIIDTIADGSRGPRREAPASAETVRIFFESLALNPSHVRAGYKVALPDFDLEEMRDETTVVTVNRLEKRRIAGVDTDVAIVEIVEEGMPPFHAQFASPGIALEVRLGGTVAKLEDRDIAKSNVVGFDVVDDGVPVHRRLGDPKQLRELTVRVTVPAEFTIPAAPNQVVSKTAEGQYKVVVRTGPGARVQPQDRARALRATPSIDADNAVITKLATSLTRGAHTGREKVARFVGWLHDKMSPSLTSDLSVASQVATKLLGDCTEYALLLIALCRASGLPARGVSGLVYMGDEYQRFGWHAWVEVELDGRWVPVDASWGEINANASHLKLGHGENDASFVAFGALSLEVLRAR